MKDVSKIGITDNTHHFESANIRRNERKTVNAITVSFVSCNNHRAFLSTYVPVRQVTKCEWEVINYKSELNICKLSMMNVAHKIWRKKPLNGNFNLGELTNILRWVGCTTFWYGCVLLKSITNSDAKGKKYPMWR